jgi:branched-chain amino acid transport system permease protein
MTNWALLLNLIIDGLTLGCIYSLLAVGFSLLWWIAGIVHVAHGAVMLGGGFALYSTLQLAGAPVPVALVAGVLGAAAMGIIADTVIYQPLLARRTDEMGLLTASLGALIVVEYALTIVFGPEGVTLDAGTLRSPLLRGMPLVLDQFSTLVLVTTAVVFSLLTIVLRRTLLGREMRAVAANTELAHVLGIDTRLVYLWTAAIAACLSLPPSAFMLFSTGLVPPDALHVVLVAAVVAIIGGRGSLLGALVAGLLVGVAESAMTWYFAAGWRQLVTFVFLYVLLLVRPQGLFGEPA